MDKESTTVVRRVQNAAESLAAASGAIVCSVTHKPERYHLHKKVRLLRLQSGRIDGDKNGVFG